MLGRSRHIFETGDHPHPGEASRHTMGYLHPEYARYNVRSTIHVIDVQPHFGTSS